MTGRAGRWSTLRRRAADLPRSRALAMRVVSDLTPPPPAAFAAFGDDSCIVPPARVLNPRFISLGRDVLIHEHAWLSVVPFVEGVQPSLTIGNHCSFGRLLNVACVGEIIIEDDVLTAAQVFIGDTYHRFDDPHAAVIDQPMAYPRRVRIGRGSFLGFGAIVLPGVTLGENAYVAAGAVVTTDVPDHTLVVGNPARAVQRYDADRAEWVPL